MSKAPRPSTDPKELERIKRRHEAMFYSPQETEALRRLEGVQRAVDKARALVEMSAILRGMPPLGQS